MFLKEPRKLHGRFLQITDMHPDPHYTHKSSQTTACHRKKPKKKAQAGLYGTPYSYESTASSLSQLISDLRHRECDSPLRLTNFTLDFIDKKWTSELDFVVCALSSAH